MTRYIKEEEQSKEAELVRLRTPLRTIRIDWMTGQILRAGRAMTTLNNDKIISVAEAHRMVARARAKGWLPPYSPTI